MKPRQFCGKRRVDISNVHCPLTEVIRVGLIGIQLVELHTPLLEPIGEETGHLRHQLGVWRISLTADLCDESMNGVAIRIGNAPKQTKRNAKI